MRPSTFVFVVAFIINAVAAIVVEVAAPPEQYMALINAAAAGWLIAAIQRNLRHER